MRGLREWLPFLHVCNTLVATTVADTQESTALNTFAVLATSLMADVAFRVRRAKQDTPPEPEAPPKKLDTPPFPVPPSLVDEDDEEIPPAPLVDKNDNIVPPAPTAEPLQYPRPPKTPFPETPPLQRQSHDLDHELVEYPLESITIDREFVHEETITINVIPMSQDFDPKDAKELANMLQYLKKRWNGQAVSTEVSAFGNWEYKNQTLHPRHWLFPKIDQINTTPGASFHISVDIEIIDRNGDIAFKEYFYTPSDPEWINYKHFTPLAHIH